MQTVYTSQGHLQRPRSMNSIVSELQQIDGVSLLFLPCQMAFLKISNAYSQLLIIWKVTLNFWIHGSFTKCSLDLELHTEPL